MQQGAREDAVVAYNGVHTLLRAFALRRVVIRAVVIRQFLSCLDAFYPGDNPDFPLLSQEEAVWIASVMIDERRPVSFIEPVDVQSITELHYRLGALLDAF